MAAARPGVEWESTYDPGMAPRAKELMAQGKTRIEVAAAIGIHRKTLERWTDPQHPNYHHDLAVAMSQGIDLSYSWWINEGRCGLTAKRFNAGVYGFLMANLFGMHSGKEDEAMAAVREIKEHLGIGE